MSEEITAAELIASGDALLAEDRGREAFEAYDRALDLDTGNASVLLRAGMALLQVGAAHEAYLYLEQAQHTAGGDPEIWRLMGVAALTDGQGEIAREALENCRTAGGEVTAETLLDLASAAYWDLDVPGAIGYARQALDLDHASVEAHAWVDKLEGFEDDHTFLVDVARAHCRQGRFGMGAELFVAALEIGDSFEARLYGGRAMLASGKPRNAAALFRAALDMQPNDSEAKQDLATALMIVDDLAEPEADEAAAPASSPAPAPTVAPEPPAAPAFCRKCGARLRPTSRFCPSCGETVKKR